MAGAANVTGAGGAVTRLVLTDFRNYERMELRVDARPVVLAGPNGAGKTNILEAISLLSPGRGLRGVELAEAGRAGPGETPRAWALAAAIEANGIETLIGTGLIAGEDGRLKRTVRINGAPAKSANELAGHLRLLWLTPAMDRLFIEGASGRRRFLDRLVLSRDAAHGSRVAAYEKAMRERMALLRDGRGDASWLAGLEEQMAETGIAAAAARADTLARLASVMEEAAGAFPIADLALMGDADAWLAEGTALAAEDRLRDALARSRGRDAEAGRTLVGPHRSDLVVRHRAKGRVAGECSTGEQKALLIAIILAAARADASTGQSAPVLLLDEIAAHLDPMRRAALYDAIDALGVQAWMTGAELGIFDSLRGRARVFTVAAGRVTPAAGES